MTSGVVAGSDDACRGRIGGSGCPASDHRKECRVFLFFSNRLGCAGSLLLSLALTALLLVVLFAL